MIPAPSSQVAVDAQSDSVLSLRGLTKHFGGARPALADVSLDVRPGEVHGLLGQNGSGKSTLIKILAGYHDPEPGGQLWVNGREIRLPLAPGEFRELGMSFVHQNLGLVGSMSVLDNMRIGRYRSGLLGRISWRREREAVRRALEPFGLAVDPDASIADLSEAARATVAIARSMEEIAGSEEDSGRRGLLILDEPTPYLSRDAVDSLFAAIRETVGSGTACLFVSHRLDEVHAITDRVTVLRDGVVAGTGVTSEITSDELVEMIIGRRLEDLYPHAAASGASRVLSVREVSGPRVAPTSFELFEGEILGLTGLVGMGFEDVPYLLTGASRAFSGEVETRSGASSLTEVSPRKALALDMVLVPAHRERDGAALNLSLAENMTLPRVSEYFRSFRMDYARERAEVRELAEAYDVRPPEPTRLFSTLSGGNQQKAIVAKWLGINPSVLLLHEPTQGVDIGARKQLFTHIRRAADSGAGVLLVSIEYEDLANLCDRVLVFQDGQIVAELRGSSLTKDRILERAYRPR